MKYLYFIFFILLYALVRCLEAFDLIPYNWISFFITDLCAMPLVLGILLFIAHKLRPSIVKFPVWFILGMTIYWSIYFEYYLPKQSSQFTGDWIDVLMYFIGSFSFVGWQAKYGKAEMINTQTQQT